MLCAEALAELAPAEGLARLILHKRTELQMSQEELAERMGTTASRIESGQHSVTMKTLKRVAAAMERRLVIGFAEDEEIAATEDSGAAPELAAV